MRRIVVLGPPGSGKSTLARQLGTALGLPVSHLDQAFWRPGWVQAPKHEFHAEVERLAAEPRWVIEGNYAATLAPRLAAADTVIYLDLSTGRCLLRILRRTAGQYGRVRPDSAPGCPERPDLAFLRFILAWNRTNRARYLALLASFPGRQLLLSNPDATSRLLHGLQPPGPGRSHVIGALASHGRSGLQSPGREGTQ